MAKRDTIENINLQDKSGGSYISNERRKLSRIRHQKELKHLL